MLWNFSKCMLPFHSIVQVILTCQRKQHPQNEYTKNCNEWNWRDSTITIIIIIIIIIQWTLSTLNLNHSDLVRSWKLIVISEHITWFVFYWPHVQSRSVHCHRVDKHQPSMWLSWRSGRPNKCCCCHILSRPVPGHNTESVRYCASWWFCNTREATVNYFIQNTRHFTPSIILHNIDRMLI